MKITIERRPICPHCKDNKDNIQGYTRIERGSTTTIVCACGWSFPVDEKSLEIPFHLTELMKTLMERCHLQVRSFTGGGHFEMYRGNGVSTTSVLMGVHDDKLGLTVKWFDTVAIGPLGFDQGDIAEKIKGEKATVRETYRALRADGFEVASHAMRRPEHCLIRMEKVYPGNQHGCGVVRIELNWTPDGN